jgi:alkaline phosphatase
MAFYDATPAACYSQVNSRGATASVLKGFLNPRYGDGVDILIGAGRPAAAKASAEAGFDFFAEAGKKGYKVESSPPPSTQVPSGSWRYLTRELSILRRQCEPRSSRCHATRKATF